MSRLKELSIAYLIVVCPHYWFAIEKPGRDQCPFGGVCCYRTDSQVHPEEAEHECKAAGGRFHNKPRQGDNRYVCEMGQGMFTIYVTYTPYNIIRLILCRVRKSHLKSNFNEIRKIMVRAISFQTKNLFVGCQLDCRCKHGEHKNGTFINGGKPVDLAGFCHHWCSKDGYCGNAAKHIANGTDCTHCPG